MDHPGPLNHQEDVQHPPKSRQIPVGVNKIPVKIFTQILPCRRKIPLYQNSNPWLNPRKSPQEANYEVFWMTNFKQIARTLEEDVAKADVKNRRKIFIEEIPVKY